MMMRRIQQKSIKHADCGVACVAMLARCRYRMAFRSFGFLADQVKFDTLHHQLISALARLGCAVKRKRFRSWRQIEGSAIVAVNYRQDGSWHWVVFDGDAILDPLPNKLGRKKDFRGVKGFGYYLLLDGT